MQFKMTNFLYNLSFEIVNFNSFFKLFYSFLKNNKKILNNNEY